MRLYTGAGHAIFYCAGHPLHRHGHRLAIARLIDPETGASSVHHSVLDAAGDPVDGEGHHMIVFAWVPGCVHIDDHADSEPIPRAWLPILKSPHPILRGCDQGCGGYVLVAGDDPRDVTQWVTVLDQGEIEPPLG